MPANGEPGKWVLARKDHRLELCTAGCLHFYDHPMLVEFHKDRHVSSDYGRLWEVEIEGATVNDLRKSGARKMRLARELKQEAYSFQQKSVFVSRLFLFYQEKFKLEPSQWSTSKDLDDAIRLAETVSMWMGPKLESQGKRFLTLMVYALSARSGYMRYYSARTFSLSLNIVLDALMGLFDLEINAGSIKSEKVRAEILAAASAAAKQQIKPKPTAKKAKPKPTAKKSTRRPTKAKR